MRTPTCAKCGRVIPSGDINVANDVAYCRECNVSYRLSEITHGFNPNVYLDLSNPPKGAWYRTDATGTVVGATNRNLGAAVMLTIFALFWNGIVSVFVVTALAGILHQLHIPVPVWFPAPKMNNASTGTGETLFLSLFLTPFVAIGLFLASMCLTSLFGRTEVKIDSRGGTIFTGVGPIGWRRRFDPARVYDVRINQAFDNRGHDTSTVLIEAEEGKQLKLGSLLTNDRRQFVLVALRKSLVK